MADEIILAQLAFIFLHYVIGIMFFWHFKKSIEELSKVVNEVVKSPRNRKRLETHIEKIRKNKKLSAVWPLVMLLDLKDDIKK